MQVDAFIFDLDGVITDTANYHFLAWKKLADSIGVAFNREKNELLRGVSRRQSLLIMLGDRQATEEELLCWMNEKNEYYKAYLENVSPADLLPGVIEVLSLLKELRIKIAIGSASKNAGVVLHRLGIEDYLDAICDGFSVDAPKPAPDLFLYAAEKVNAAPEKCVVVEDAAAGIEAGIAAGMVTIGIGPTERVGNATMVLENGFADIDPVIFLEKVNQL